MDTNNSAERIEQYLFKQMPADERTAFEREIQSNPALADEVALTRAEHGVMQEFLREDLRANLQTWRAEREAAENKGGGLSVAWGNRAFLYRAAAVLIAVAFGVWTLFLRSPAYDSYLVEPQFGTTMGGSTENALKSAEDLMKSRTKSGYESALSVLDAEKMPEFAEKIHYYRGICLFRLENYEAARTEFLPVAEAEGGAYQQDAQLNLLVTYAKLKRQQEMQALREKILQTPGHAHHRKAMEMD